MRGEGVDGGCAVERRRVGGRAGVLEEGERRVRSGGGGGRRGAEEGRATKRRELVQLRTLFDGWRLGRGGILLSGGGEGVC